MSTTNKETNYQSGDELTFEFGGNYRVGQRIQIGATGYAYVQTTDDNQNGAIVNGNGNRGRVFALGPSMTYIFTPKVAIIAKVQFEFGARNRPEGTRACRTLGPICESPASSRLWSLPRASWRAIGRPGR